MPEQIYNNIIDQKEVRANLIALKELLSDSTKSGETLTTLKALPGYSSEIWKLLLQHEDAKVRKNVALIIGMLGEEELLSDLMKAYRTETTMFVKASYLKAMTHYSCEAYWTELSERLETLTKSERTEEELKHVAEEIRALRALLPEQKHQRHRYQEPTRPVRVLLTCPKENRERLLEQVTAVNANPEDTRIAPGGVMVKTTRINRLSDIRIYQDLLFIVNGGKSFPREQLVKEITEGNLLQLLSLLHRKDDHTGAYAFRISTKELDAISLASRIEAASKGSLKNSVSDYEIEIRLVHKPDDTFLIFIKLFTKKDLRFNYRKNTVATSMNPVKAAIMMEAVKDYLKEGAQVLDPFCGVATLMIERDRIVSAGNLYGTDIFGDAIVGGRANAELAGTSVPIHLIHRDFYDFTHEYLFDEILTQFPDYERDASEKEYQRFFQKSLTLLNKGGRMILNSKERGLMHKYLRLNKEYYRLIREIVLNERLEESVYVIERI